MEGLYDTPAWARARRLALERDGRTCTVSRLLGGPCQGPLHVHHIVPVGAGGPPLDLDNLGSVCRGHHPRWEKLRRTLARTVEFDLRCQDCDLAFRRTHRLAEHRRDVHGEGLPVPDWEMNRLMVAELVGRLRRHRAPRRRERSLAA